MLNRNLLRSIRRWGGMLLLVIIPHRSEALMLSMPNMSPAALGRAGVYSSLENDDPLIPLLNPGALGIMAMEPQINAGFYPVQVTPLVPYSVQEFRLGAQALNAGVDLRRFSHLLPADVPISFGVGIHSGFLRFGEINWYVDPSHTLNGIMQDYNWGVSLGMGFHYLVKAGLGVNFNHTKTNLPGMEATASPIDLGIIAQAPLVEDAHRLFHTNQELLPQIQWEVTPSFGYSVINLGAREKVNYDSPFVQDEEHALGRTVYCHAGMAAELRYVEGKESWQLLSLEAAVQAEDYMTASADNGGFYYRTGMGDIRFWNDLIVGWSNNKIAKQKGWEIGLLSALYLRTGTDESSGMHGADYRGIGLRLSGFLSLARHLKGQNVEDQGLAFLSRHLDVRYDYGERHYSGPRWFFYDGPDVDNPADIYQAITISLK